MATNYWPLIAAAVAIAAVTFGLPWILAEVFPWRNLYNQRHGRPTPNTKSYKGRTALVTGANGAFGSRASKIFAHRDIETLVLVDVADCTKLKEEIEAELVAAKKPVPKILVWQANLMTYAACREVGEKALSLKSLDHVLMTAGILAFKRRESPEGWETCKYNFYGSKSTIHSKLTSVTLFSDASQFPLQRTSGPTSSAAAQVGPRQPQSAGHDLCHYVQRVSRLALDGCA